MVTVTGLAGGGLRVPRAVTLGHRRAWLPAPGEPGAPLADGPYHSLTLRLKREWPSATAHRHRRGCDQREPPRHRTGRAVAARIPSDATDVAGHRPATGAAVHRGLRGSARLRRQQHAAIEHRPCA